jgi:uncharacterized protein (TIGR03067 family)
MALPTLTVVVAGLLLGQAPPSDTARREAKALQGTWRVTALELDGTKLELPEPPRQVVIDDDRLLDEEARFTFQLDVSADPKVIDLVRLTGPDKGQILEGIYRLRGDTLTVFVFGGAGVRARPTAFQAPAGSGRALVTLQRQKD